MVYQDYKNYAVGLQGLQRQILRLHCDYKKNLWDYNKITKKKREDYKKITKKSVGIIIHYRQWIGHICSPGCDGLDGWEGLDGWDGWDGEQKCPSIFFISRYIKYYTYIYIYIYKMS